MAGHCEHKAWPVPVATDPGEQALHCVAAELDTYFPGSQLEQGARPLGLYWPAPHTAVPCGSIHESEPSANVSLPLVQAVHWLAPKVASAELSAHSVQALSPVVAA